MKKIYFLCVCIIFFSSVQVSTASLIKNGAQVKVSESGVVAPHGHETLATEITGAGFVNVPEPATLFLLGSGLISFAAGARKKFKQH